MAVVSFRTLLPTLPSLVPSLRNNPHAPPILPLSDANFPEIKPLHLNRPPERAKALSLLPFLSLSPSHARRPFLLSASSSSAAAAYTESDDEAGNGEEEEETSEGEHKQQRKPITSSRGGGARLYVGNLPYSMTPSELAQVFGEAGTVEAVEILYDRVTDRSRGFAFVAMASVDDANEAIRMFDGSQVGGRTLKVNFPEVPRGGEREVMGPRMRGPSWFSDSPHKLYAGNLGWTVTSEALREAFAARPGLLGAKVVYDRDTGRSRGFGFVSFASDEECRAAMEAMDGVEVRGRPLRLSPAARRPPASPSFESASAATDPRRLQSQGSSLQPSMTMVSDTIVLKLARPPGVCFLNRS